MRACSFPLYNPISQELSSGSSVPATDICRRNIHNKRRECIQHYEKLRNLKSGYYPCPFGFSTRLFYFDAQPWMITGLIAHPRFNSESERALSKKFSSVKVSRENIDAEVMKYEELDRLKAETIQKAAAVFPQAFHELRKLLRSVLHNAESHIKSKGESTELLTIVSAAELMRNNFEILEALANPDAMKAMPIDQQINPHALLFKMKKIYHDQAKSRGVSITVLGVSRLMIKGNQKSFPIVPAVLLENAIKYARPNSSVNATVSECADRVMITVENDTDGFIDPNACFDKGTRYAGITTEGSGFGLFLAREVVEAHGGSIRCQYQSGKVRMTVDVPRV